MGYSRISSIFLGIANLLLVKSRFTVWILKDGLFKNFFNMLGESKFVVGEM